MLAMRFFRLSAGQRGDGSVGTGLRGREERSLGHSPAPPVSPAAKGAVWAHLLGAFAPRRLGVGYVFVCRVSLKRVCASEPGCASTCVCLLWKCIQGCHLCARVKPGCFREAGRLKPTGKRKRKALGFEMFFEPLEFTMASLQKISGPDQKKRGIQTRTQVSTRLDWLCDSNNTI